MSDTDQIEQSAQQDRPNTVEINDLGPTRKKVTVTIPAETVDEHIGTTFDTLEAQTALPGFRPGRAPRRLVERRFGSAVRQETKQQLISSAYSEAIKDNDLKPIGEPQLDEKSKDTEIESGKPFSFCFEIETVPSFDLPPLDNFQIKKPTFEITQEKVDEELKRQTYRHGNRSETEGPFEPLDRLFGPAIVHVNDADEPFREIDDAVIVVPDKTDNGRGQVLGLLIDNLDDKLLGKTVEDTITIETTGPEAHELEELRSAKLTISFDIKSAQRLTPLTPQELIEGYGMGTEDNLRQQLQLALEEQRDQNQRSAMRQQVHDKLLESVDFALPEQLTQEQVSRSIERQRMELLYRGFEADQIETHLAETRGQSEENARNRLKLFFILQRAAEHFEIEITESDINNRIASIARQRGERVDQLKQEFEKSGRRGEIAMQVLEHRATDRIIDESDVTEVSQEEFEKEQESEEKNSESS